MSNLGKRSAEEALRPNKRARQREQKKVARQIAVEKQKSNSDQSQEVQYKFKKPDPIKLPAQINVEKELASYAFEAQSLLKAIKSSSVGSSIRAWQLLPRHKRRRNASHNLLALPKRLRQKGRSELKASNTNPLSRSDIRRRKGKGQRASLGAYPRRKELKRSSKLIERATKAIVNGNAWLETHMWHAKRFRMSGVEPKLIAGEPEIQTDRWGFNLAEESQMKSFRSSWRDEKKAVTIMDRSYDSWFRLCATVRKTSPIADAAAALSKIIQQSGIESGWQDEWHDGRRACMTLMTKSVGDKESHIDDMDVDGVSESASCSLTRAQAPVQVVWIASPADSHDESSKEPRSHIDKRKRREILLRTHPSCTAQVERAIRQAILPAMRGSELHARFDFTRLNSIPHPIISAGSGASGRRHKGKKREKGEAKRENASETLIRQYKDTIQREWMRQQAFNVFEIGGPSACALMSKVFVPVNKDRERFERVMKNVNGLDGEVITIEVLDPRLSFPPRTKAAKDSKSKAKSDSSINESRLLMKGCPLPKYSSGEIQSRRARLLTPGARLLPTSKDDVIPVVLIRNRSSTQEFGWTILLPRGWGKAFWLSFVHSDTRVLGQQQLHALRFDKGKSTYPYDWVSTPSFQKWSESEGQRAFTLWQRTPPAKRCNFDKTGACWPFGGQGLWTDVITNGMAYIMGKEKSVDQSQDSRPPWLFAMDNDHTRLDALFTIYKEWNELDRPWPPPNTFKGSSELARAKSGILCVQLTACRKGAFERWDEIHILSSTESEKWQIALKSVQEDKFQRDQLQRLEQRFKIVPSNQVGSITTGQFALSDGKGKAIGCISLMAFLEIRLQESKGEKDLAVQTLTKSRNPIPLTNLVLVRSTKGGPFRAASMLPVSLS